MLPALRSLARRHAYLAGILCILLLLFGTTIQLTHTHAAHENHADCSLCVTAHAAVDIVILPTGFVAPVAKVERPTAQAPDPTTRLTLSHPLWHRPPPTSAPIA